MNIYLTTGIDATDSYFNYMVRFKRVNIKDLVLTKKTNTPSIRYNKFQVIIDFIKETMGNVLIGNAINSIEDFRKLEKELELNSLKVHKIFIKNNDSYSKYKTLYSNHSNWLDYSPEYIKSKQEEYNLELKRLGQLIKEKGIDLVHIR